MPAFDWKIDDWLPVMSIVTPRNVVMSGLFGKSFAYFTVRQRLPIIITKIIDLLAREKDSITKEYETTEQDIKEVIMYCTKLKNDIVTNKQMDLLSGDTDDVKNWNKWIRAEDQPFYFTAIWIFTECYVYRRLREAFENSTMLKQFDPFRAQKDQAYQQNLEAMSIVADRLVEDILESESEKGKTKEHFVTMLKLALWANKCDLSLSVGAELEQVPDPFASINEYKDKLLVDESAKIADYVLEKSAALTKQLESPESQNAEGIDDAAVEVEKKPCPSKMNQPQSVIFDIICDNAGYELFTDLCLGHFLVARNIVQTVRFHVKQIPWFVSDTTPRDFQWVIDSCAQADFVREVPIAAKADGAEVTEQSEDMKDGVSLDNGPKKITSENLKKLGEQWQEYVKDGSFVLVADSFWTTPHIFKDMKKYDPHLYRKLQFGVCALFKGDLNYRKLLGERNWNPVTTFEKALEGFHPAPVAAVRTVKADLICGLPRGKWEALQAADDKWMEKGDYGLIQFCTKKEELKVSDMPCAEYGNSCKGATCG